MKAFLWFSFLFDAIEPNSFQPVYLPEKTLSGHSQAEIAYPTFTIPGPELFEGRF